MSGNATIPFWLLTVLIVMAEIGGCALVGKFIDRKKDRHG